MRVTVDSEVLQKTGPVSVNNLIEPNKSLGYSSLYLDFIAGLHSARHFYSADNIDDLAPVLQKISYPREELVALLTKQNTIFGAGVETFRQIEKLKDENALCVFSGQQACLFGGPLLVLIKALAIVKTAKQYEKQLNCPVLPIFWIAGDDHDFEEANHCFVLSRDTQVCKISYDTSEQVMGIPTSDIYFSDEKALEDVKQQLKQVLGETDFTGDLYELIEQSYDSGETMVTAFGKFMARLTSEYGLIFFSPGDRDAKKLAIPFLQGILRKQDELHKRISSSNNHILKHGYHIQVEKKENATYLFYNLNGRHHILRSGSDFTVNGQTFTLDELIDKIEQSPELFSPDVMTRPVMQSYLFPVISQKGGPSEIAYLAQINNIFDLFDRVVPFYVARPTATILERRFDAIMSDYDISFEQITGDIEQVVNRVLGESFPDNLQASFDNMRAKLEASFQSFLAESVDFDPALRKFGEQIQGKIDYLVKQFEGKTFSSHKKKSQQIGDRIRRLQQAVYPRRGLQERTVNVSYFLARYGTSFIAFLYDRLDPEETSHQLLHLSEMDR